jgi:protein-disulfide isomerase/uncharacterized membrane protein
VVDCDSVAASPYAEIFDIPFAAFGAVVYMLVISLVLFGSLVSTFSAFSLRAVFLVACVSLLFDAYLAVIGFFILRKICLVCIFTYVVNIAMLYYAKMGLREKTIHIITGLFRDLSFAHGLNEDKKTIRNVYFCTNAVIVLFSIVIVVLFRWHYVRGPEETAEAVLASFTKQTPVEVNLAHAPRAGNSEASVKIVEFSDFRCPYCRKMAHVIDVVRRRYPDDVAVYFKHYPMDSDCNRYVGRTLHLDACKISYLAICAQERGLFWDLHELFFTSDKHFMKNLKESLKNTGVDSGEFFACSSDIQTRRQLSEDIHQANRLGVEMTPTLFINGYRLAGYFDPLTLSKIVEHFLANEGK